MLMNLFIDEINLVLDIIYYKVLHYYTYSICYKIRSLKRFITYIT